MSNRNTFALHALSLALASAIAVPTLVQANNDHDQGKDFGMDRDLQLEAHSMQLFGVKGALDASSTTSVDAATAEADPLSLVTLARSLRAKVVASSADLAPNIDMMTLWPSENPTHMIVCNEQDDTQPGVQRVRLSDGQV
jgi:hypothetical protein